MSTVQDSAAIKDKIQKLLAVASCESASDGEKAAALHQAARLAEKHAIDLDALGSEASEYGSQSLFLGRRKPPWIDGILEVLSRHFNVKCYRNILKHPSGLKFIEFVAFGCRPSREVAVYVFGFLRHEFQRIAKAMKVTRGRQLAFYRSLAIGLIHKLDELNGRSDQSYGLILKGKLEAEFRSISAAFGKAVTRPTQADRTAYLRGREIDINPALRGTATKAIAAQAERP